jgi:hypothetical protein
MFAGHPSPGGTMTAQVDETTIAQRAFANTPVQAP